MTLPTEPCSRALPPSAPVSWLYPGLLLCGLKPGSRSDCYQASTASGSPHFCPSLCSTGASWGEWTLDLLREQSKTWSLASTLCVWVFYLCDPSLITEIRAGLLAGKLPPRALHKHPQNDAPTVETALTLTPSHRTVPATRRNLLPHLLLGPSSPCEQKEILEAHSPWCVVLCGWAGPGSLWLSKGCPWLGWLGDYSHHMSDLLASLCSDL